jgi:uncharacterized protein YacL (UPF0231 family)
MWKNWNEYLDDSINSNDPDYFDESSLSLSSLIKKVKKASQLCGKECSIFVDLEGPVIRT